LAVRLRVKGVSFGYGSVEALNNITFEVRDGELLSIIGPNGSGKSTLLRCIDKILKPKKGVIMVDERDILRMNLKESARTVGYVPQSAVNSFPFTVFDVVLMGRKPYISWGVGKRDIELVSEILEFLGLSSMAMRYFNELSGGERQKVLIARALAQEPELLLFDEPTSNLDIRHQLEVLEVVRNLKGEKGVSVIMAMHDLNLASRFSDRLIMLNSGRIFATGTPEEVLIAENIREVYGVEVEVSQRDGGHPQILPLKAV
jgi:iron complex transport system ATP-binding protein